MYKKQGSLYYSPSDLTRYMDSPYASWMDRLVIEQPDIPSEKDPGDPLMRLLAHKGYAHEDALEATLTGQGLSLIKIESGSKEEKREQTLVAMHEGVDVIVQARLELDDFGGFADFLVKVSGPSQLGDYHYEVWDTKLATKIKPTFVIQLCCYAEMLESIQGYLPAFITVALGNGEQTKLRTRDYFYYYQSLKAAFLNCQNNFDPDKAADPAESRNWANWSGVAEQLLIEKDHLFQVANITRGQIKKLNQANIATMQQLADTTLGHVSGINPGVLEKLKSQAAIQKQSVDNETPHSQPNPHNLLQNCGKYSLA